MKKWIALIVVVALLGSGSYYYFFKYKKKGEEKKVEKQTAKVERGGISNSVESTGKVISNLDVEIKSKASGEVRTLPYDISQKVSKGELLVELDPVDEERRVKQAQVALASSEARLNIAKYNLQIAELNLATDRTKAISSLKAAEARCADATTKAGRLKELHTKQYASDQELDSATTTAIQAEADRDAAKVRLSELDTQEKALELQREQVKLAEAEVETDKIDLDIAQQRLTETKVIAPMDGVVTARTVQIGTIISSGISNVGGGTALLTLSDLSRIFALASVDESDIGSVKVGQRVEVTVDAYPGVPFPGQVDRIATRGAASNNVVTFEVKIEILSPMNFLLKPEMTANVKIIINEAENVLVVPADSVVRKEDRKRYVTVVKNGVEKEVEVKTGITDGMNTEIKEGIAEGDEVLRHEGSQGRWMGGGMPAGMRMMMGGGMGGGRPSGGGMPPRSGGGMTMPPRSMPPSGGGR